MSFCSFCRPFALNDLDDYEKHFTVMNYDPEVVLKQVSPGGAWGAGSLWKLVQTGPHARQRVFGPAVYWSGELPCGTRVSSHRCPQRSEGHTTLSSGRDNGALRLPWFLLHGPRAGGCCWPVTPPGPSVFPGLPGCLEQQAMGAKLL